MSNDPTNDYDPNDPNDLFEIDIDGIVDTNNEPEENIINIELGDETYHIQKTTSTKGILFVETYLLDYLLDADTNTNYAETGNMKIDTKLIMRNILPYDDNVEVLYNINKNNTANDTANITFNLDDEALNEFFKDNIVKYLWLRVFDIEENPDGDSVNDGNDGDEISIDYTFKLNKQIFIFVVSKGIYGIEPNTFYLLNEDITITGDNTDVFKKLEKKSYLPDTILFVNKLSNIISNPELINEDDVMTKELLESLKYNPDSRTYTVDTDENVSNNSKPVFSLAKNTTIYNVGEKLDDFGEIKGDIEYKPKVDKPKGKPKKVKENETEKKLNQRPKRRFWDLLHPLSNVLNNPLKIQEPEKQPDILEENEFGVPPDQVFDDKVPSAPPSDIKQTNNNGDKYEQSVNIPPDSNSNNAKLEKLFYQTAETGVDIRPQRKIDKSNKKKKRQARSHTENNTQNNELNTNGTAKKTSNKALNAQSGIVSDKDSINSDEEDNVYVGDLFRNAAWRSKSNNEKNNDEPKEDVENFFAFGDEDEAEEAEEVYDENYHGDKHSKRNSAKRKSAKKRKGGATPSNRNKKAPNKTKKLRSSPSNKINIDDKTLLDNTSKDVLDDIMKHPFIQMVQRAIDKKYKTNTLWFQIKNIELYSHEKQVVGTKPKEKHYEGWLNVDNIIIDVNMNFKSNPKKRDTIHQIGRVFSQINNKNNRHLSITCHINQTSNAIEVINMDLYQQDDNDNVGNGLLTYYFSNIVVDNNNYNFIISKYSRHHNSKWDLLVYLALLCITPDKLKQPDYKNTVLKETLKLFELTPPYDRDYINQIANMIIHIEQDNKFVHPLQKDINKVLSSLTNNTT